MQNNKFIFLEQQKIAIKLCNALELSLSEFSQINLDDNELLRKYMDKCKKESGELKFSLPEAERIYFKDFHFLDEPLFDKQKKKEEAKNIKAKQASENPVEESKGNKLALPIFSNQKDESN